MCKIKGHIVKNCRSPLKAEWIKKRQRQNNRKDNKRGRRNSDEDSDRGRTTSRNHNERSNSRGRSSSSGRGEKYYPRSSDRDRSVSRGRSPSSDRDSTNRRKSFKESDDPWSSAKKGRRQDSDSEESNMIFEEEWEGNTRISMANMTIFHDEDKNEWVCIDSGSNQVILTSSCGISEFLDAINAYLRTAQAGAQLVIASRGLIGNARVLHVPNASANIISTRALNSSGAKVISVILCALVESIILRM